MCESARCNLCKTADSSCVDLCRGKHWPSEEYLTWEYNLIQMRGVHLGENMASFPYIFFTNANGVHIYNFNCIISREMYHLKDIFCPSLSKFLKNFYLIFSWCSPAYRGGSCCCTGGTPRHQCAWPVSFPPDKRFVRTAWPLDSWVEFLVQTAGKIATERHNGKRRENRTIAGD